MEPLLRSLRAGTRLAGVAASIACGGSGGGPAAPAANPGNPATPGPSTPSTTNAISVRDNAFDPASTTVPPGTTVTWTWAGSNQHNVTFDDGTASTTRVSGTFTRAFATAGTFPYQCTVHAGMAGSVRVQ